MKNNIQIVICAVGLTFFSYFAKAQGTDTVSTNYSTPGGVITVDTAAVEEETVETISSEQRIEDSNKIESESKAKVERLEMEEKAAKESLKASKAELNAVRAEKKARRAEERAEKAKRKAEREKAKLNQ